MPIINPGSSPQHRAYAFVDGAYIREELRRIAKSEQFDPHALARGTLLDIELLRVYYYDAVDDHPDIPLEQRGQSDILNDYFAWLRRLPDTHVQLGSVRRARRREQKGVDVQLAVDAMKAGYAGVADVIGIFSGDADFVPLVMALREIVSRVIVVAFETSASAALVDAADRIVFLDPAGGGAFNFRP